MKICLFIIQQSTVLHKIQKPVHPQNPRITLSMAYNIPAASAGATAGARLKGCYNAKKQPDGTAVEPDGDGGVPLFFKVNAKVGNKCFKIHMCFISSSLPGDYPVDNLILLAAGTTQVNPVVSRFLCPSRSESREISPYFSIKLLANRWRNACGCTIFGVMW